MDHGQVTSVADGVKGRGRLSQVLPNDGGVANLAVTEAKLEVGEADGA
jgi:hypothetical protein